MPYKLFHDLGPNQEAFHVLKKVSAFMGVLKLEGDELVDHKKNNKLISSSDANKIARKGVMTPTGKSYDPADVECSQPWYSEKCKELNGGETDLLPPVTQLYLYRIGPEVPNKAYLSSKIYRGVRDTSKTTKHEATDFKPVLFKQYVMSHIREDTELEAEMDDAKTLAHMINETAFGPSEVQLRRVILDWQDRLEQARANRGRNRRAANPNPGAADPNPGAADPNPGAADPNPGAADPNPGAAGPNLPRPRVRFQVAVVNHPNFTATQMNELMDRTHAQNEKLEENVRNLRATAHMAATTHAKGMDELVKNGARYDRVLDDMKEHRTAVKGCMKDNFEIFQKCNEGVETLEALQEDNNQMMEAMANAVGEQPPPGPPPGSPAAAPADWIRNDPPPPGSPPVVPHPPAGAAENVVPHQEAVGPQPGSPPPATPPPVPHPPARRVRSPDPSGRHVEDLTDNAGVGLPTPPQPIAAQTPRRSTRRKVKTKFLGRLSGQDNAN